MTERTRVIILKTLIVNGAISLFLLFPGLFVFETICVICSININSDLLYKIIMGVFAFFMIDGSLMMLLMVVFGGVKPKPVKAEKHPIKFNDFSSFKSFLENSVFKINYELFKNYVDDEKEFNLYVNKTSHKSLSCYYLVKVPELTDKLLDDLDNNLSETLEEYYGKPNTRDTIDVISIFCVDRVTPSFQKLMNTNMQQDYKKGILVTGISFGGKSIYIAKQIGGYGVLHYKKLREDFIKLMGIEENPEER